MQRKVLLIMVMMETIQFSKELDLSIAQFQIYTPVPGSPLFETIKRDGKLFASKWEDFNAFSEPLFEYQDSRFDLMMKMQQRAYREYYFRPKMFLRKLLEVKNLKQLDGYIKAAMAVAKMSSGKSS